MDPITDPAGRPPGPPPPFASPPTKAREIGADGAAEPADSSPPDGLSALVGEVRQLASDAKTLAEAELAFQTSRARYVAGSAQKIAVFGVAAFVLAFFALGALTVGLLLALTPLVTAWGATAIVVGALAIAAFLCIKAATTRIARMSAAIGGEDKRR